MLRDETVLNGAVIYYNLMKAVSHGSGFNVAANNLFSSDT